jgi:hypothetical protein
MVSLIPKKDSRGRITKSVSLYVAYSNVHFADGESPYFEIVDSCERAIFKIKGGDENWYVRYDNYAYRLYTPKSFRKIVKRAKASELSFKSYTGHDVGEVTPSFYCILERNKGHFYRF